jgi:hypothetical protein
LSLPQPLEPIARLNWQSNRAVAVSHSCYILLTHLSVALAWMLARTPLLRFASLLAPVPCLLHPATSTGWSTSPPLELTWLRQTSNINLASGASISGDPSLVANLMALPNKTTFVWSKQRQCSPCARLHAVRKRHKWASNDNGEVQGGKDGLCMVAMEGRLIAQASVIAAS